MNSQKIHSLNFTPISYQITSSRQDESSLQVLKTPEQSILEASADTYREVIKQLSTQLQECIVENKELKNKLNLLENENEESFTIIHKQNEELQNTNIILQQKINNLVNEIQLSQTQMLEKETHIVKLQDLEQNTDKVAHLLDENNKLINIIETQSEEIKTKRNLIQQFEQQVQQNVEQNKEKHNKIDILQREIEIFKTQNDQFKDQVNLWNSRYQSLEQNYQIQYNDLYQKFNLSQSQISELKQQLKDVSKQHNEELESLKQEYEQKLIKNKQNNKTKLLEEQIEDLKEQLQFKKNQIQSLREELIDSNKPNKKNESNSFNKYEDKIRQLEEQIQVFTKELSREPNNRDSNYYNRQSDTLKLQLFSEKKDYLRPQYKENIPETRFNYSYKYYRND